MSEEKYEVTVENGQIVMNEEMVALMKRARSLDMTIKELTAKRDAIVKAMKAAMDANGIDVFDSSIIRIARSKDSEKEYINTEKMKKDGIYDQYCYTVPKKGSLTATYPKGK